MSDARKPGDVHPFFVAAFNAGDLDALMRCSEPEACFISKSGRVAAGVDAVREAYRRTLANKPHMELEVRKVLPAGRAPQRSETAGEAGPPSIARPR